MQRKKQITLLLQGKHTQKCIQLNNFNKKSIIKQKLFHKFNINKQYYPIDKKLKRKLNKIIHLKYLALKDFLSALCFCFIENRKLDNLQQKLLIQNLGII